MNVLTASAMQPSRPSERSPRHGEHVERVRGHLYALHQLMGHADLLFGDAAELLGSAGHDGAGALIREEVVGRNLLDGRWTFQMVDEFEGLLLPTGPDGGEGPRAGPGAGRPPCLRSGDEGRAADQGPHGPRATAPDEMSVEDRLEARRHGRRARGRERDGARCPGADRTLLRTLSRGRT